MSEATVEIPAEVNEKITAAHDAIKNMSKDELMAFALERGEEYKEEEVNEGFLRRKCRKLVTKEVLKEAGIEESTIEQATAKEDKPKKPGRKKMSTKGDFAIVLAEGQSTGRSGSTKNKIVEGLMGAEKFTYDEFQAKVAEVMEWDAAKEEFGITTKFPGLTQATAAWFSELKNKQEIIKRHGEEPKEEAPAETEKSE